MQARLVHGNITKDAELLLRINWHALKSVKLLLAHNGLSHVHPVHVAAVADVTEAEIEVVAVEADPVAHSLRKCSLTRPVTRLLTWVFRGSAALVFLLFLHFTAKLERLFKGGNWLALLGRALVENLVLALDAHLF